MRGDLHEIALGVTDVGLTLAPRLALGAMSTCAPTFLAVANACSTLSTSTAMSDCLNPDFLMCFRPVCVRIVSYVVKVM